MLKLYIRSTNSQTNTANVTYVHKLPLWKIKTNYTFHANQIKLQLAILNVVATYQEKSETLGLTFATYYVSFKLSKIVVTKHKFHFYVDQLYVVRMNDNDLAQRSHHPNSKSKIASLVNINTNEDLSIYIPWPFPPFWGVADNTKEQQKQWGFHSVLLAMTRDPAEFGWHCWSNTAHPPPSSTTCVAS